MAILIQKSKKRTETAQDAPEQVTGLAIIDELGALSAEIDKLTAGVNEREAKALAKIEAKKSELKLRMPELEAIVRALAEEKSPDQAHTIKGVKFNATAGKAPSIRAISDMSLLRDLLDSNTPDLFLKLASVKLADVDSYLTPEEKEVVLIKSRGKRPVTLAKNP